MDPVRRGLVIVHGVGEPAKGDWIDTFVEPLADFLGRALGYDKVELIARAQRENATAPSATLHLTLPDGGVEAWHIREAWWTRGFTPSRTPTVIVWAVGAFIAVIGATLSAVFWRNLRRGLAAVARWCGRLQGRRSRGWRRLFDRVPPENEGRGVWQVPVAGGRYHVVDAIIWLVVVAAYTVVFLTGLPLIVLLYLLLSAPLGFVRPAAARGAMRALLGFLTNNAADQHAMANRTVAVAAAANAVSTALQPFLDPPSLQRRYGTEDAYRTVTVVAYSGGCLVSYEALAGREVRHWMERRATPARVTWITVGSGLNLAWRMRAPWRRRDAAFWGRRLDGRVNWIDIYSRYDFVPQGRAPDGGPLERGSMVKAIAGPPDGLRERGARPYVGVRVANTDWPFSDHGAYWSNDEEVMARIVFAVADDRFGRPGTDWTRGDVPAGLPLGPAITASVGRSRARRRRVTRERAATLAVAAGAVALLLWRRDLFSGLRRLPLTDAVAQRVGGLLATPAGMEADAPALTWLADAGVWAAIVAAIVLLARLIAHWRGWARREE